MKELLNSWRVRGAGVLTAMQALLAASTQLNPTLLKFFWFEPGVISFTLMASIIALIIYPSKAQPRLGFRSDDSRTSNVEQAKFYVVLAALLTGAVMLLWLAKLKEPDERKLPIRGSLT